MKKLKIINYNDLDYKYFKEKTRVNCDLNIDTENIDYSWVEIFGRYIPYLDAIIRNPRRFIESEEDLVPIERSKRINEESIKHLAQHTQLIQSVGKDNMPQPVKILNVYKEETYDLYENRFISTLIKKLYIFITMQYEEIKDVDVNTYNSAKSVVYNAKTLIGQDEYVSSLKINVKKNNEELDLKIVKERIKALYEVILEFRNSPLMKQLEKAEPVRSPIRKTNAILKDVQLRKCLELWEVLEKLQNDIKLDVDDLEENFIDEDEFVEGLALTNYLNFCTLTHRKVPDEMELNDKAKNIFYDLIKIYTDRQNIGIANFRRELLEDLDMLCMQYENDYKTIEETYEKFFASFTYFN